MKRKLLYGLAATLLVAAFAFVALAAPTTENRDKSQFTFTVSDLATVGNTDFADYLVVYNRGLATIDFTVECDDGGSSGTVDEFIVLLKRHPSDAWASYLSGSDWDTATVNNPYTEDVATIAEGATASARIYVGAAYAVAFQASAGTEAVDTVTIRGSVGYD